MPTYEYACTSCGERTEARLGFDDPPLEECPHCGGRLRKLYSPVGIVFKGSGFYSTDAKGSKKSSDSGGGSSSSSSGSSKSSSDGGSTGAKTSSGDSKSDAKAPSSGGSSSSEKSA